MSAIGRQGRHVKKSNWEKSVLFLLAAVVCGFFVYTGLHYAVPLWKERRSAEDLDYKVEKPDRGGDGTPPVSGDVVKSPEVLPPVSGEIPVKPLALVALVMDDCGPSLQLAKRALAVELPITWSILPEQTYSEQIAKMLNDKNIPYLAHVPMQAQVDPDGKAGERKIYHIGVGMGHAAVTKALSRIIDAFPGAIGINNHRGSRATEDEKTMSAVMDELAKRQLLFLDSNTSTKTIAYDAAKKKGLKSFKNSHFLDNVPDQVKIAHEMRFTIEAAKERGSAIAICHLRTETVVFLEDLAKWNLAAMGVRLVTLPQLVDIEGNSGR